jgi:hypothetical protein
VLLALVLCAPAQAATTVARDRDFTLRAFERDGRVCMTLRRDGHYRGQRCGRIPRSPQRALVIEPDTGINNFAAAVPPSVRSAEIETESGARHRHRTVAARGFFSRFVLLPAPPAAVFVRYYGADGTLLGVDPGPVGYISFDDEAELDDGSDVHTETILFPTPHDPDRLRTIACLDFTHGNVGGGFCDVHAESGLSVNGACAQPHRVGGIVAAHVTGVRLTLGTGAQVTLDAQALPDVYGGRQAITGFLPAGEGVRAAEAVDAAGRVVARRRVGMPPANQPCPGDEQGSDGVLGDLVPTPPPVSVAVASAGGETLVAADQGERLCAALARIPTRLCPPAPVDSDRPQLLRRGRAVAGVLSRDAARITLRLDRGGRVTVATTGGAAYQGRWAGDVTFFAARVPARRRVTGAVVRNAAGTIIGISARGVPELRRRILAERAGRGIVLVRRTGHPPCLTAFATQSPPAPRLCTDLNPGQPIDGPVYAYTGVVTVPCAPRRAIAYGRMLDRFATPVVQLAGGRTVRSRRIRLRGQDAWVAFLPDARVRRLRSGRFGVPLALPAAAAQCGYSISRDF